MGDEALDGLAADTPLSAAALSKLRWRCRRGLLENDLFIERFFNRHADTLTVGMARGMYALMALADNDLLDVLLNRPRQTKPDAQATPDSMATQAVLALTDVQALLPLLRT
jgi:antitoxin CptB